MPAELVAVDQLLDDERFFEPFRRWFDPAFGRPSIPMETYLRRSILVRTSSTAKKGVAPNGTALRKSKGHSAPSDLSKSK